MRTTLLTLFLLAPLVATAATVYKWVDERGVTHYSDQPHPGAQKIEVRAPQTYSAPPAPAAPAAATSAGTTPAGAPQDAGPPYSLCEIYQPVNDQVFLNVPSVSAKLRTEPGLRAGDRAMVALDGRNLPDVSLTADGFTISPIYRGTHTLIATVLDPQGRTVCQTEAVTFHVRQPSILAPNRRNR